MALSHANPRKCCSNFLAVPSENFSGAARQPQGSGLPEPKRQAAPCPACNDYAYLYSVKQHIFSVLPRVDYLKIPISKNLEVILCSRRSFIEKDDLDGLMACRRLEKLT